jgi:flagellar FliL protein
MSEAVSKGSGGGGKRLVLGVLIGSVVAGGGATGAFLFLGKKANAEKEAGGAAEKAQKKPRKHGKHAEPGPVEKLPAFVVNLRDSQSNRYLKVALEIELGSDKDVEKFKKYQSAVRHEVLMYLSNLSVAEIQGEGAKHMIAKEILAKTQKVYEAGDVQKIFFTEFVIQ